VDISYYADACTHNGHYRPVRSIEAALAVIRDGRGKQFDPALVDLVLEPRVVDRLTRTHVDETNRHAPGEGAKRSRRNGAPERAPDVSFRWRSESLGP